MATQFSLVFRGGHNARNRTGGAGFSDTNPQRKQRQERILKLKPEQEEELKQEAQPENL